MKFTKRQISRIFKVPMKDIKVVTCRFTNDDVPRFLKRLAASQKRSLKSKLVFK